jgi:hypothetical protein
MNTRESSSTTPHTVQQHHERIVEVKLKANRAKTQARSITDKQIDRDRSTYQNNAAQAPSMNTTSHGRVDSRSRGADSRSRTRATTSAATDASILAGPRRRRTLLTPSWTLRLGSVDLFAAPSKSLHHYTNRRENPPVFPLGQLAADEMISPSIWSKRGVDAGEKRRGMGTG